ncbi:CD59 glycoprotein-like isoform 1-T2 [Polymixia lowei]
MRSFLLSYLAVGVCIFGLAQGLKCYSCPNGSSESCQNMKECDAREDACLRLTLNTGMKYSKCINYADCDFQKLGQAFGFPSLKFNCCQSNLCNAAHSTAARPLIGLLAGLTVLWLGIH